MAVLFAIMGVVSLAGAIYSIYVANEAAALADKLAKEGDRDVNLQEISDGEVIPLVFGTRVVRMHPIVYGTGYPEPIVGWTDRIPGEPDRTYYEGYFGIAAFVGAYGTITSVIRLWYTRDRHFILGHEDTDVRMDTGSWTGLGLNTPVSKDIDEPDLFGGDDEDGGMAGTVTLYAGGPLQDKSGVIGDFESLFPDNRISAFRNFFTMFLWGGENDSTNTLPAWHWGKNPYIKPEWYAEVYNDSRIHNDPVGGVPASIISLMSIETDTAWNQYEMNPAKLAWFILVTPALKNPRDPATLDEASFAAAGAALATEKFGLSHKVERESAKELLEMIEHTVNCRFRENYDGLLEMKLIRPDYSVPSLKLFDENNVVEVRKITRASTGQLPSSLVVEYTDLREEDFKNTYSIDVGGTGPEITRKYPMISTANLAATVGNRDLSVIAAPLLMIEIVTTRDAVGLLAGDAFRFEWPLLEIPETVMRVENIGIGDDADMSCLITAIEDIDTTHQIEVPEVIVVPPEPELPETVGPHISLEEPYEFIVNRTSQSTVDAQLNANRHLGYVITAGPDPDEASEVEVDLVTFADDGSGFDAISFMEFTAHLVVTGTYDREDTSISFTSASVGLPYLSGGAVAAWGTELVRIDAVSTNPDNSGTLTIGRGVYDTVPVDHTDGEIFQLDPVGTSGQYLSGQSLDIRVTPRSYAGYIDPLDAAVAAEETSLVLDQRAFRPYAPGYPQANTVPYATTATLPITFDVYARNRLSQAGGSVLDDADASVAAIEGSTVHVFDFFADVEDADPSYTVETALNTYTLTATELEEDVGLVVEEGDANWDDVNSLLHFDTDFTDARATTTWTASSSNCFISSAQSVFGGSSVRFQSGAYLSLDAGVYQALNVAANEAATFECWFRLDAISGTQYIMQHSASCYAYVTSSGVLTTQFGHTGTLVSKSGAIVADTWYYLSLSRDASGNCHMTLDGSAQGLSAIATAAMNASSTNRVRYGLSTSGTNGMTGYIDEARWTIGFARNQVASFTPGQVTADAYTEILLDFESGYSNGGSGSYTIDPWFDTPNTYYDNATYLEINSGDAKYGSNSLWSAGFNGYPGTTLEGKVSSSAQISGAGVGIGTSDFLVEFWFKTPVLNESSDIFGYSSGVGQLGIVLTTAGSIRFDLAGASPAGISTANGVITINTWHHIAIGRQGDSRFVRIDGVLRAAKSDAGTNSSTNDWGLGGNAGTYDGADGARYDNFRYVKGTIPSDYHPAIPVPVAPFIGASTVETVLKVHIYSRRYNGEFDWTDSWQKHELLLTPSA